MMSSWDQFLDLGPNPSLLPHQCVQVRLPGDGLLLLSNRLLTGIGFRLDPLALGRTILGQP